MTSIKMISKQAATGRVKEIYDEIQQKCDTYE